MVETKIELVGLKETTEWKFRPNVELRFELKHKYLLKDTEINSRWNALSGYGDNLTETCQMWVQHCTLPSNRALVSLEGREGGLYSEDEQRQIRFRRDECGPSDEVTAYVHGGIWSLEELTDLITGFATMFNGLLAKAQQSVYCTGSVQLSIDPLSDGFYEKEHARCDRINDQL